jgi:hypothetical protein
VEPLELLVVIRFEPFPKTHFQNRSPALAPHQDLIVFFARSTRGGFSFTAISNSFLNNSA